MISYIFAGIIIFGTIGAFSMNVESTVERNRQALVRKKSLPPAYRTDRGVFSIITATTMAVVMTVSEFRECLPGLVMRTLPSELAARRHFFLMQKNRPVDCKCQKEKRAKTHLQGLLSLRRVSARRGLSSAEVGKLSTG